MHHQTDPPLLWDPLSGTAIPKGINYKLNSTVDNSSLMKTSKETTEFLSSLLLAFQMRDSVSAQQMELADPFTFEPIQQYLDEEYERLAGRGETF